jgi:ribosomal-protein-alanine N-acetyltransferase
MEGLTIRPLRPADADAIERITGESPEAAHWSAEGYLALPGWVAENASGVLGFLLARVAADEMEILNLAVTPSARQQGVGSALLGAAVAHGSRSGAFRVFLEVRESNLGARRFYERHGFLVTGRRPRYYRGPDEDALIMGRTLDGEF